MDNLLSFWKNGFPQNEIWYNELVRYIQYLSNQKYMFCKSAPGEKMIQGFRFILSVDTIDGDIADIPDIPDEILEYFIEVPFTRFYDKDTNFFCYGGDGIENGKELYKRLVKLNLTEGEWFVPNGYIFMIPDIASDDRGIIMKVRKVGNIFEYESCRNGQPQVTTRLLPTGESWYM